MALTTSRRSELRAQAHKLTPVVIIGDKKGLTDEVLAEIDRSLKAHELIKIRAATANREAREAWMRDICARLDAQAVQQIGKVLVVYRENFDKPREKNKAAEARPRAKSRRTRSTPRTSNLAPRAPAPGSTRSARPRPRTPSPRPESGPRRRRRSPSQ